MGVEPPAFWTSPLPAGDGDLPLPLSLPTYKSRFSETSLPLSQGLVSKLGTAPITAGDSREGAGSLRAAETEVY